MIPEVALKLGRAIAQMSLRGDYRHKIVIGKDTRVSGYMLEFALSSGICSMGVDVCLVDLAHTSGCFPDENNACRCWRCHQRIAQSFSRQRTKIFGPDGFKLDDGIEAEIESMLDSEELVRKGPTAIKIGKTNKSRILEGVISNMPNHLLTVHCAWMGSKLLSIVPMGRGIKSVLQSSKSLVLRSLRSASTQMVETLTPDAVLLILSG